MPVLRTSNFQGATIRPIVPRHLNVHNLILTRASTKIILIIKFSTSNYNAILAF